MVDFVENVTLNNQEVINEEDLCVRCGECCRLKKRHGRTVFAKKEKCPHNCDNLCTIYGSDQHQYLKNMKACLSAEEAWRNGLMPKKCPYVKFYNAKYGKVKQTTEFFDV
jgi:uncharacterized cysteine cluster protein YcgN (CxxCxxCC family)